MTQRADMRTVCTKLDLTVIQRTSVNPFTMYMEVYLHVVQRRRGERGKFDLQSRRGELRQDENMRPGRTWRNVSVFF